MTSTDTIRAARELLRAVTPLKKDCGRLCAAACCQPDGQGRGGMLLFPGEEVLYTPAPDWAEIEEAEDFTVDGQVPCLFVCRGECPRDERPLACRIFPLTPVVRDGAVAVEMDVRAWLLCPLAQYGMAGLAPAFVRAAQEAARLLWNDAACRKYIEALTEHLKAWKQFG